MEEEILRKLQGSEKILRNLKICKYMPFIKGMIPTRYWLGKKRSQDTKNKLRDFFLGKSFLTDEAEKYPSATAMQAYLCNLTLEEYMSMELES